MASFGKKILSAFVEVTEEKKTVIMPEETQPRSTPVPVTKMASVAGIEKFKQYFDKLFNDANLPGPDYFEFAKMTQAMMAMPDEKARYAAAYAGLSVQGLDKSKLLETAGAYLKILETDAANFSSTVDAALAENLFASDDTFAHVRPTSQGRGQPKDECEPPQRHCKEIISYCHG